MADHPYEPVESPVVVARHASRCGCCDGWVRPGDHIVEVDGEWCHTGCAEEQES